MEDYWVIIIAVLSAIILLLAIFLALYCYIRQARSRTKKTQHNNQREPSVNSVRPKPSDPIFTISPNSVEKKISNGGDTVNTRRISTMLDPRKRLSAAFQQKQQPAYFDFENSPAPKHKEYLDFSDIERILPQRKQTSPTLSNETLQTIDENPREQRDARITVFEEAPFDTPDPAFEPVREVYSENHVSFRRDRPMVA